jgi:carbon storage regulator
MLILARRTGERVVIGDEILVTVMEISGSTVRLGIEAPQGISIFREEIWLAVKEENRAAAEVAADALPAAPIAELAVDSSESEAEAEAEAEAAPDTELELDSSARDSPESEPAPGLEPERDLGS